MKSKSQMKHPPSDPERIEQEASQWLARSDRGLSAAEEQEFARWQSADSRHASAIGELGGMWGALDDLAAVGVDSDLAVASSNERVIAPEVEFPRRNRNGWLRPLFAAAAAVAVLGGSALWLRSARASNAVAHYETRVGQEQAFALSDGSTLQLDTNTAVAVRFSSGERRVDLERGAAFFAVAKNPARPFVVSAGNVESRAVGTAFVVTRQAEGVELLVTEGRVRFGAANSSEAAEIRPTQLATLPTSGNGEPRVEILADDAMARRLAWKSGRVECYDTPLSEAVSQMARYHSVRLILSDAETANTRVSGSFRANDLEAFLHQIQTELNVTIQRPEAGTIILGLKRG